MIKRLLIMAAIFTVAAEIAGQKIPKGVETLRTCTEELCRLQNNDFNFNRKSELQMFIQDCFGAKGNSGIEIYNPDIFLIGAYHNSHISSQRYSIELSELIYNNDISIKHDVEEVSPKFRPDYGKDELFVNKTLLTKYINYRGTTTKVYQQIITRADDQKIYQIESTKDIIEKNTINPNKEKKDLSLDDLHLLAAEYYTGKDYKSAYETYQLITTKYESDFDGWYRLAMMTYKKKGCNMKNNKKLALEYLYKADKIAKGRNKKVRNIIAYWHTPNRL